MVSEKDKKTLVRNISFYLAKKSITQTDMANDLNLKESTVSAWMTCARYPRMDKIELMARYFGVNKIDLIEDMKQVLVVRNGELYDSISDLPEDAQDEVKNYIELLKLKYKR